MNCVPGRVSILICTLNRAELSVRAIRSALEQSYPDVEVIVSDDKSTDDTVERVCAIKDPRVKMFVQPVRLGIVANPQFALGHATGEYLIFFGDDDVLLPGAMEKLAAPFECAKKSFEHGTIGAVWCPVRVADRQSEGYWPTESGPEYETAPEMLAALFAGNRGPRCSSVMIRTADARAMGGFDPKYGDLSDIGVWGRSALLSDTVVCVREPLVQYTMHQGNVTIKSSVKAWQDKAKLVHADMLQILRERGDEQGERVLKAARSNFISGVTLTILLQTIGKPGWVANAAKEILRSPRAILSAYFLRRLIKDGKKIFALRHRSRRAQSAAKA